MNVLITGCCGFIGSHLVRKLKNLGHEVYGFDVIADEHADRRYVEIKDYFDNIWILDISSEEVKRPILPRIDAIINMASETFVDKSIKDPELFIKSNIIGTYRMLELAVTRNIRRFIQISTDEVYGASEGQFFYETDRLQPGNPYSATKAGADMMCLAYQNTYNIGLMIVRPENNYGIMQSPEKAIPNWISKALNGRRLTVYGDGEHRRMWLHVNDCCEAIIKVMESGESGEIYNVGGKQELTNNKVVEKLCANLNREVGITYVPDEEIRPGHDRAYAIDNSKILALGWKPQKKIDDELPVIIDWYKANPAWQR